MNDDLLNQSDDLPDHHPQSNYLDFSHGEDSYSFVFNSDNDESHP